MIQWKYKTAYQSPELLSEFNELESLYEEQLKASGDFSERLMELVNRIIDNFPDKDFNNIRTQDITKAIYQTDIRKLNRILHKHLQNFDEVWILFDNIDKGFPSHGLQNADVLIIRCLLEATRKLQVSLEKKSVECIATVFIRKDVFDHLVDLTPDRGKESYVNIDWSDIELIKELLLRRIRYQVPELTGSFEEVWRRLFDPHVGGENSFTYLLSRTFLRPRDILNIVRKCIQVAVSHGHDRVFQEDMRTAESQFSIDILNELRYEIRDIFPEFPDLVLSFLNCSEPLSADEINERLSSVGVPENKFIEVRDILLWFSFLGMKIGDTERYSYEFSYNVVILEAQFDHRNDIQDFYVIHPAFRKALG